VVRSGLATLTEIETNWIYDDLLRAVSFLSIEADLKDIGDKHA
jgi:hypothetical protein